MQATLWIKEKKDAGVIISGNLKPSKQCTEAVKRANKILGFRGRAIEFLSPRKLSLLFTSNWYAPSLNSVFSFGLSNCKEI